MGQTNDYLILDYKVIINAFYNKLMNGDSVSIYETSLLFGSYSMEWEDFFFYNQCDKNYSAENCDSLAKSRMLYPRKYKSLFYEELKKNEPKLSLGQSIIEIQKAIENIELVALNEVEININGKKIVFTFSNYQYDKLFITDIFLQDKSSIFNWINESNKKHYYWR
jgi:hypothetical protein